VKLGGRFTTKVALNARALLIHCHLPSYETNIEGSSLEMIVMITEPKVMIFKELIDTRFAIFDVRISFIIKIVGMRRSVSISNLSYLITKTKNEPLRQYPWYFTFRETDYTEDQTIRHIVAYQLELTRLSNFDITPCYTDNRKIHVYYAVDSSFDPGRLRNSVRKADYIISESDRLLNEILDSLEIVSSEHKNSDCNYLFINFIPTFVLEPKQVEETIKRFINRHAKYYGVEDPTLITSYPLRVIINNVSGYVVKVETYQESEDRIESWILKSIGRQ
ncbi:15934_t:CDS:2, partial [Funneliformis geosporum]